MYNTFYSNDIWNWKTRIQFFKTKFVAYTTRLSKVSNELIIVCECSEETIHSFHSLSRWRTLVGRFPKNVQEGYQIPVPSLNLTQIPVSNLTLVQTLVTKFKIPDTDPSPSAVNRIFAVQKRANPSSYFVPSRPSYKCSKNKSSPKVDLNTAYSNFLDFFMLPFAVGLSCNDRLVAFIRKRIYKQNVKKIWNPLLLILYESVPNMKYREIQIRQNFFPRKHVVSSSLLTHKNRIRASAPFIPSKRCVSVTILNICIPPFVLGNSQPKILLEVEPNVIPFARNSLSIALCPIVKKLGHLFTLPIDTLYKLSAIQLENLDMAGMVFIMQWLLYRYVNYWKKFLDAWFTFVLLVQRAKYMNFV